jgi:DNA-binding transcriptional MerR regulator
MVSHGVQIGKLARDLGLSVDTIRFYEKEGLLRPPPRSQGGYRLYTRQDMEHLRFIRCAQELGFSLAEVRELLLTQNESTQACAHVRDLICQKLETVNRKREDLKRIERALKGALEKCETALGDESHPPECCPVLDQMGRTSVNGKASHEN